MSSLIPLLTSTCERQGCKVECTGTNQAGTKSAYKCTTCGMTWGVRSDPNVDRVIQYPAPEPKEG